MKEKICLNREFVIILVLLMLFMMYIVYIHYFDFISKQQLENNIKTLKEKYNNDISEYKNNLTQCNMYLTQCNMIRSNEQRKQQQQTPERIYENSQDYQNVGFLYDSNTRYPLYGRRKYPNKSDKWEYYIIDESRNKLPIPFKTQGDNELYDDDTISVETIGTLTAKIYEYKKYSYVY